MLRTRSNSRWTVHPWAQLSQSTLPLYVLRIPLCHTIHFHHVHRMVPNNNIWNQICLRLCEEIQIPQRETDSEHWIDRNFLADFSGVFISQGASNKFPSCGEEIKLFFYRQTDSKCPARAMDYCDDQGKKDYTALCRDKVCQLAIKNSYSGQHLLQIKRNTDIHLAAHGCTRNCGLIEKGLNKKKKTIMWNKINAIHQPHREPKQLHEWIGCLTTIGNKPNNKINNKK